jgi:DNA-binding XRE family transcriptional regulator
MATVVAKEPAPRRARAQDVDRHVGARMRERRVMLGLTQQQMAELIGVTYQQAHKYEKGINRVAAGRLYNIAQALGVDMSYFFEGLSSDKAFSATPSPRSSAGTSSGPARGPSCAAGCASTRWSGCASSWGKRRERLWG